MADFYTLRQWSVKYNLVPVMSIELSVSVPNALWHAGVLGPSGRDA